MKCDGSTKLALIQNSSSKPVAAATAQCSENPINIALPRTIETAALLPKQYYYLLHEMIARKQLIKLSDIRRIRIFYYYKTNLAF